MSLYSYSHPPINLLINFEVESQRFYRKVFMKLKAEEVNKKNSVLKEEKSISEENKKKKSKKKKKSVSNKKDKLMSNEKTTISENNLALLEYDDMSNYILQYSPCYASITANHLLRLVNKNPMVFRDALWNRTVNICCLGGGSASEVIAISKLFSAAQAWFWLSTRKPLHLQVTIVDKNCEWEKITKKVLKTLSQTESIFDASTMSISFQFVLGNLAEPMSKEVINSIEKADIVTMTMFISAIVSDVNSSGISLLTQNIATYMKDGALLFYLDTGFDKQWKLLFNSLDGFEDIKCIYGPVLLEPFTPDITVPSTFRNTILLLEKHNLKVPITLCINSCAWIKTKHITVKEISSNINECDVLSTLPEKSRIQKIEGNCWQWNKKVLQTRALFRHYHRKWHIMYTKIKRKRKHRQVTGDSRNSKDYHFLLNYPLMKYSATELFQNKPKDRRIFLGEFCKRKSI